MGQGILNEVYWPTAGEPQIRDMGFIVAGDGWWYEVKAVATYQVQTADPAVPLASIVHAGPAQHPYRLTLQVIPDPGRDVVLVSYMLDGVSGAQLYAFLASHLQQHPAVNADQDYSGGADNTAWVDSGGSLFAQGAGRFLCLASGSGFGQASAGYFGSSDLWQDFSRNGSMTWNFTDAGRVLSSSAVSFPPPPARSRLRLRRTPGPRVRSRRQASPRARPLPVPS